MSVDPGKPVTARVATHLRMLTAASRLKQFTLAELAEHAGVGEELARSFLRRNENFEPFEVVAPDGRGRPKKVWRLRPDRVVGVAARVAEEARLIGWAPEPQSAEGTKTWQLLRSSLDRLDKLPFSDAGRPAILRRAEMYLASSEMELRDRVALSLPVDADERSVIAEASRQIRVLGAISRASDPFMALLNPSPHLRSRFRFNLADWAAPVRVPDAELPHDFPGADSAPELLDMAMYLATREGASDSVLVPAMALVGCKPGLSEATRSDLVMDLERRISRHADDAFHVTALAATAAAFEIDAAVDPLFHALSNRRLFADRAPEWRTICRSSLARFAHPGRSSDAARRAAAACNYLLTETEGDPQDFPLLAAAAFGARHADSGSLLRYIGQFYVQRPNGSSTEGPMMRNLGLVLGRDDFAPLQMHIDELLEREEYGPLLLRKVNAEEHKALTLSDEDQGDSFVVRASSQLAACLGQPERITMPRLLQVKEEFGARLREMIRSRNLNKKEGMLNRILTRGQGGPVLARAA